MNGRVLRAAWLLNDAAAQEHRRLTFVLTPEERRRRDFREARVRRAREASKGKGRFVTYHHPGATGHERCQSTCVTYG